jgi:molybdopterin-guanine dinucleotide biosynthesis protein MobB
MKRSKSPVVLGFYGLSDSGKTILLEKLINDLTSQGFHVAAVKVTSQLVSLDSEGKDTHRLAHARANPVAFASPIGTTILQNLQKNETQIIADLRRLSEPDFIFIEGAHDAETPKIRIGERPLRANTVFTYEGDYRQLSEFVINLAAKEK